MKIINLSTFGVIVFLSFFGMLYAATILHELSHKEDFKPINPTDEEICVATLNSNDMGWYSFSYENSNTEKKEQIKKYTELKAYSISALIFILFLMSILMVIKKMVYVN